MAQALNVTKNSAKEDIETLMSKCAGSSGEDLSDLPNKVADLIQPPKQQPVLPKSNVGMLKAAVLTYQTWAARSPAWVKLVGLLIGKQAASKKRWVASNIIVGTSMDLLVSNGKVKLLCEDNGLQPVGVILRGSHTDEEVRSTAQRWCFEFLKGLPEALCVTVSWLDIHNAYAIPFKYYAWYTF